MDQQTIIAYNDSAGEIAALHAALLPKHLYQLMDRFFIRGTSCADVGCGIGRDTHWLSQQGYDVTGIDAAEAMLAEARTRYPKCRYIKDSLPLLMTLPATAFVNVLCSAVMMHLHIHEIPLAITHLLRILAVDGIILTSFRCSHSADQREMGKLYTPIDPAKIIENFNCSGATLLYYGTNQEDHRSLQWHNLVFKKLNHPEA